MFNVVSFRKILQDGTAFPDLELLTAFVHVDDGWDATIWIDL